YVTVSGNPNMMRLLLIGLSMLAYTGSLRSYPLIKSGNVVNIDVFGASRCIHTSTFMHEQLLPTYRLFGSRLRIQYHPFGVTKYTKCEWEGRHVECFCQHGPSECLKNALQACVISYLPEQDDHLELINCIQGGAAFNDSVNACLTEKTLKSRTTADEVARCARSDVGRSLMAHHGWIQNRKAPEVPWVLINATREKEAEHSLQRVLCKRYFKPPPPECAGIGPTSSEQL
ncbi:Gamma interferon inducible lysosomal thiol reductase, partial [Trichostrongylus colubriformis]